MKNFEDVKVGDTVYEIVKTGINQWRSKSYARTFFIGRTVLKLTKTQFTTENGRYRKSDGYAVGNCNSIYILGDKPKWTGREDPEIKGCEAQELADYENELKIVREALFINLRGINIDQLPTLKEAQKAAMLLSQLAAMFKDN